MSKLFSINRDPTGRDLRSFAVVMGIAWVVVAVLVGWRGGHVVAAAVIGGVGALLSCLALFSVRFGRVYYVGWMTWASWLGRILFPVFLTVMYFVVLPVFSLIRFSDPLRLKLKRGGSYWEPHRPQEPTIERMHRLS